MTTEVENLPFSYESVMANLDSYRNQSGFARKYTKEQNDFIIKCRDNDVPVSYEKMIKIWEKLGWGKIGDTCLKRQTKELLKK